MALDLSIISKIRETTGAGIVDVKKALEEANGKADAAIEILRKKGAIKAAKKASERVTREGIIECYTHAGGKVGVMVEVLSETDFVARNEEFKQLAHDLALHIAAADPIYLSPEMIAPEVIEKEKEIASEEFSGSGKPPSVILKIVEGKIAKWYSETCLLSQAFIKDEDITIKDLINNVSAKVGEKIEVKRFCRFAIGTPGATLVG
jgi:elongation factor Ts